MPERHSRKLTKYGRARLALRLKPVIAEKAKEKQIEAGGAVRQKSDKAVVDTKKELAKGAEMTNTGLQKSVNPIIKVDTQKELAKSLPQKSAEPSKSIENETRKEKSLENLKQNRVCEITKSDKEKADTTKEKQLSKLKFYIYFDRFIFHLCEITQMIFFIFLTFFVAANFSFCFSECTPFSRNRENGIKSENKHNKRTCKEPRHCRTSKSRSKRK